MSHARTATGLADGRCQYVDLTLGRPDVSLYLWRATPRSLDSR